MTQGYVVVLVTCGSKQEAEKVVQNLLDAKLIACGNIIGPVTSFFRWYGKSEKAEEWLALMKSRRDLFDKLAAAVKALHSYEVPEILALPVVEGAKEYLDWLESCLR